MLWAIWWISRLVDKDNDFSRFMNINHSHRMKWFATLRDFLWVFTLNYWKFIFSHFSYLIIKFFSCMNCFMYCKVWIFSKRLMTMLTFIIIFLTNEIYHVCVILINNNNNNDILINNENNVGIHRYYIIQFIFREKFMRW